MNHDALWQSTFPDLPSAMSALDAQLRQLAESAAADRPQKEWDELFTRKVVRPILFLGQSLVQLPTSAGLQTPTSLKKLFAFDANGRSDPVGAGLALVMNNYMQTILLGIPGPRRGRRGRGRNRLVRRCGAAIRGPRRREGHQPRDQTGAVPRRRQRALPVRALPRQAPVRARW